MSIDRSELAIRRKVLVVPTVSCVNRVVEMVERIRPDVAVLTHQHGCGMFDHDVAGLSTMLAATAGHPHVAATVLVSLGCESNQPEFMLARMGRAVPTAVVRFQDHAGHDDVVAEVIRQLDELTPRAVPLAGDLRSLKVGVLVEDGSSIARSGVPGGLVAELARRGAVVHGPNLYALGRGRSVSNSLPEMATATLGQASVGSDAQEVSALVASGCHLVVVLGDRPGPLGSPVAPVLTAATDPSWTAIADVVVSVVDTSGAVESLLRAVDGVVAGALTLGEQARVRTLSVRRVSMTM
ncbi:MAG TPA: UxaA family hydrolase [Ilumatobacteraceae bacterium]|nr:UxaA family hydrolase [Ilumatobacteraceae bacterium]